MVCRETTVKQSWCSVNYHSRYDVIALRSVFEVDRSCKHEK